MSYEYKIKTIIDVLLSVGGKEFLTLDLIVRRTGYSKRSVQNYLLDIDGWVSENGLPHTEIIRKQGKGVALRADAVDRLKIEKLLSGRSLSINSDDNKRRLDIIKKLIVLEDEITVRSLAALFYVSRSTVLSDLEWVREWLAAYKLELHMTNQRGLDGTDRAPRRKGISVSGGEVSYRNAIAGYFDSYMSVEKNADAAMRPHGRMHSQRLLDLMKIYPGDTVEKVAGVIEASEKKFRFFLTDDYYTSLLTHIVISVSRFRSGNTVPSDFAPPDDEEYPLFIIETAEYMSGLLETVFDIKVSDMEKAYICIHLVGFNALSAEQSAASEIPDKIKYLALELIKAVDAQMDTRFISDELLFFGLCLHLKSKVFRLQRDVYYKKTSLFPLSDSDTDVYNAVVNAGGLYSEICDVKPDEEELLNITCYLLLSLQRNKSKPKALLVCNEGIIERMELMAVLGNALPSVDIADCSTTYQMDLQTAGDYDFIISTEAVDYPITPVVDLSSADIENYADLVQEYLNKKQ